MGKDRPVNLDLKTLKFPPMAVASILHRISGVLLFLLIPFLLYLLDYSLRSADSFLLLKQCLGSPFAKIVIVLSLAALLYHLLAGVRHLLMDCGWGESLTVGRRSAIAVFGLAILAVVLTGIWLW